MLQEGERAIKKDYDKHIRFEARFGTGDVVSVEQPLVTTSSANQMTYEGYYKHIPFRIRPS